MQELAVKVVTPEQFSTIVNGYVDTDGLSYLDAVLEAVRETGVEMESVPKLIDGSIRRRLKAEALELNMLKSKK